MSVAGFNPFTTHDAATDVAAPEEGSVFGDAAEQDAMVGADEQSNADIETAKNNLGQDAGRAADIAERARANNVEGNIDVGKIERVANSSHATQTDIANAQQEVDNANAVEARVTQQEISNGLIGGSAMVAGLGMSSTIAGVAGSSSVDPRLADSLNAADTQGFKTIVTGMNNLEASPHGLTVNNYAGLDNLSYLQPEATPGMGSINIGGPDLMA